MVEGDEDDPRSNIFLTCRVAKLVCLGGHASEVVDLWSYCLMGR